MALKERSESVDLKVQENTNVILTITIGNAQIGGNFVRFKDNPNCLSKGEVQNLELGQGNDLIGKTLHVTTNILDANDQTNGVVVTYIFYSCVPSVTVFHDSVNTDGDIFSFQVAFNFLQ